MTNKKHIKKYCIISFSSASWASPFWVSRQCLMYELSKFYPVIYTTGRDYIRDIISFSYLKSRMFPKDPPFNPPKQIDIIKPPLFAPKVYKLKKLDKMLNKYFVNILKKKCKNLYCEKIIAYVWEPIEIQILEELSPDIIVYHPYDKFEAMKNNDKQKSKIRVFENKIINLADLIISPSKKIADSINKRNVHIVRNGVFTQLLDNLNSSEQYKFNHIPHPRLGYIGVISTKIDYKLLLKIAQEKRDYSFILMGHKIPGTWENKEEFKSLKTLNNVYFFSSFKFDTLITHMQQLDIGMMPYILSGHAGYCESPLKMYQYWLCGLPIVSSQLPNVEHNPGIISCSSSLSDWLTNIDVELKINSQYFINKRKEIAIQNSWKNKASQIFKLINTL